MLTTPAILGERVTLGHSEGLLFLRKGHLGFVRFQDVAQSIVVVDKVVAGEDIAVVLNGHRLAAELRLYAGLRGQAHGLSDRGFKEVNVNLSDVTAVPVVPYLG